VADDVVLGADLGTSGLKLVVLAETGAVVAEAEAGYPVDRPRPGWAQTDVRWWQRALDEALAAVTTVLRGHRVRGLGIAGQMHGAVVVDDAGVALTPALLWPDQRATEELSRWWALPPDDRAALANPLAPGMTGPLAAWLLGHDPALLDRAAAVLLPKDALRAVLLPGTPVAVTDRSDASATLLWDVPADAWSAPAVAAAGLPGRLLPAVRASSEVLGAARLSLGEVPVVVGGADTPLALLAAGTPGLLVNLGTGAQVLRSGWTPVPVEDPVVHGYADVTGGWYRLAALQNGGSAWEWVCGVLRLTWAELFAAAASAPRGAGGAAFRPFLLGERGGVAGPEDRGAFTGLSARTGRAELARAAVEGVAAAVADAVRLLEDPGDGAVVLTGGGGRAAVVRQVLADALGRPVRFLRMRSASAVGAALLAARGVGLDVVPQRDFAPPVEPAVG
jgi:xylulokinase